MGEKPESVEPKCAYVGCCPYCLRDGWWCAKPESWVGHYPGDPNYIHRFVSPNRVVDVPPSVLSNATRTT